MENRLSTGQKNRDLEMLEIIDRAENGSINQRGIARDTRMALGLVNSCLRRMIRKGFIKVKEAPGRRYLYYVTPKGFLEKSRLTYEYIRYSVHFYGEARERCRQLFSKLEQQKTERVALLVNSDLAEIAYITLQEFDLTFAGIYDEAPPGSSFFGHEVRPMSELRENLTPSTVLAYTGLKHPDGRADFADLEFLEFFG